VACTFIKFADDIRLGETADMLKSRISVKRDLDRLEEWASRNVMNFHKDKFKVLHLGRTKPLQQSRQGNDWLGNSCTEKDLRQTASSVPWQQKKVLVS